MKPYRRRNPRETKWLERILSSWQHTPEHVATSKRKFIYFLRSHPVKSLCFDSRRLIVKALFGSLDSNIFWKEVFQQVFDDRHELREFRRAVLRVIDDVDDKRARLSRSCVSHALAWPKDPNRSPSFCHIQAMPAWHRKPLQPDTETEIMARLMAGTIDGDERFIHLVAA